LIHRSGWRSVRRSESVRRRVQPRREPAAKDLDAFLRSVQWVYFVTDTKTGKLYVGKADGAERILGLDVGAITLVTATAA